MWVLSDHGVEVDGDESTCHHCHLIPGSRGQRRFAGSFGNLAMKITKTKSVHSLNVGMDRKNSSRRCNKWILGHETHRSLYPM